MTDPAREPGAVIHRPLTPDEAAARAGVPASALLRNGPPSYRLARRVVYDPGAVDAWRAAREGYLGDCAYCRAPLVPGEGDEAAEVRISPTYPYRPGRYFCDLAPDALHHVGPPMIPSPRPAPPGCTDPRD